MNYMDKKNGGFTLTEVLVVVGIVVFLAVISLIYLRNQVYKARDAKRKADMHLIQVAVEEYEKDHDCYPPEGNLKCDTIVFSVIGDGLTPYLSKIPCDPISGESYPYEPGGPTSCWSWYRMYALLDNEEVTIAGPGGVNYDYYVSSPNAPTPPPATIATPTPGPTSTPETESYWGCFDGACLPIFAPYCLPKFPASHCSWQCTDLHGNPINECQW